MLGGDDSLLLFTAWCQENVKIADFVHDFRVRLFLCCFCVCVRTYYTIVKYTQLQRQHRTSEPLLTMVTIPNTGTVYGIKLNILKLI